MSKVLDFFFREKCLTLSRGVSETALLFVRYTKPPLMILVKFRVPDDVGFFYKGGKLRSFLDDCPFLLHAY